MGAMSSSTGAPYHSRQRTLPGRLATQPCLDITYAQCGVAGRAGQPQQLQRWALELAPACNRNPTPPRTLLSSPASSTLTR
jgi:hypothetical protein